MSGTRLPSCFRKRHLPLLVSAALAGSPCLANPADADPTLARVVVSATRTETTADTVPTTITVLTQEDLARRMPHDEAALFVDEPDVVVARDLRRFGAGSVNIRGIEGNRVLQQVDGVRLPDYYNGGGPSNATTSSSDSPEFDFLKRVEVLRGPASSLYGSDALGGVVSYLTLDPRDILGSRDVAARYKGTWRGADNSFQNTAYFAGGNEQVEALLALTRRAGSELDNRGEAGGSSAGREQPNPQENSSRGTLARLVVKPAPGHRLRFTYEDRHQQADSELLRLATSLPRVSAANGSEDARRERVSFDWEWKPAAGFVDRLLLSAYHQSAANHTNTLQTRSSTTATCSGTTRGSNTCLIDMNFDFRQQTTGASLQLEQGLVTGALEHFLVLGADWRRHQLDELRDYLITNQTTGTVSKSLAGDTYPLRDFAPGESTSLGLFAQDEIGFGRLTLTPGLRLDSVKLRPDPLAKTIGGQTFSATGQDHSAASPKLAAIWRHSPALSFYGQVVRGFRAPNYEEVNGLFYNSAQNYASLPNPDLKPETSTGVEVGSRFKLAGGDVHIALYNNKYSNFISNELICSTPSGASQPACLGNAVRSVYQSINLASVRIRGAELRGNWALPGGFRSAGAIAWSQGDVTSADQPLNTVDPARLYLNLGWDGSVAGRPLAVDTRLRAARKKDRVDSSEVDYFRSPGYAVMDLSASLQIHPRARLNVALNNLFDKKYWLWSDIRQVGLASTDAGPAFFTQPGRNLATSLQVDF
ncbi:TonB-dependent hemoglobin/transferrin/lactoferrin family receptor [Zoogloea dura]|uniref:TonB-dependent hemoglobin/transferrin/lactoferrin family receptor n=1 Tax=Zoogloea dura TaxID=2728840 RepID=A0A848G8P5_9RHOO|nr:TonB-dependent hemoglobin/transferrin/lactoferrin family receptor [Zoogloea dura]NML27690.1 TonB-dependent hemoglobin/transferrin/lactoferrin family receptor [Zoogloea dura]